MFTEKQFQDHKPQNTFDVCTSTSGQTGTCTHKFACVLSGGRPGGSCHNGKVCCVSKSMASNWFLNQDTLLVRKNRFFDFYLNRCGHYLWANGHSQQHLLAISFDGHYWPYLSSRNLLCPDYHFGQCAQDTEDPDLSSSVSKLYFVLCAQIDRPLLFLRLDFESFTTAQPREGTCTDTFEVYGSTTVTPTICGDNSGQHSKKRPVTFEFLFS
jgi:hypothetical protein